MSHPLRLALLSTRSGPRAARFALLCDGLAARGHQVAAVCPPGPVFAAGVTHLPWRGAGAWWNPFSKAQLALALSGFRPDVVHAHGGRAARMAGGIVRRIAYCPLVASLSGREEDGPAIGHLDRVLLSTPAAAERFAKRHPAVPAEAVFPASMPMEVDANAGQALRERLAVPWGAPVALARMAGGPASPSDGWSRLLEVWEWVGEAELWVVGDGSPRARELEAQCRNLGRLIRPGYERGGQVNGVRFFGPTDAASALAACDVAVLPAAGQTRFLAEALQAGKPVVAAGDPWAPSVLPPACAVPAEDADALRAALSEAVSDAAMLREAQAEAFAHARREWTPDAVAARVEAAYLEALAARVA